MPRDRGLEEMLSEDLHGVAGLKEKAMFGGWAWMLHGNLLCGAREDGMLVRLGKDQDAWALALPGIEPMVSRERRMHGWVRAAADAYSDDALRKKLLDAAMRFVRSLPPK